MHASHVGDAISQEKCHFVFQVLLVEDQGGDGRCEGLRGTLQGWKLGSCLLSCGPFAAGEMMLGPGKGGGRGTGRAKETGRRGQQVPDRG